jgi:hypothetical protein
LKLKNIGHAALIAVTAVAFVIGSAVPGDAKGKKKKAEAAPKTGVCIMVPGPVCATKGGMKFTYANSCYASYDGAKVVSNKACPAPKAKKAKKASKKKAKKADKKK